MGFPLWSSGSSEVKRVCIWAVVALGSILGGPGLCQFILILQDTAYVLLVVSLSPPYGACEYIVGNNVLQAIPG